MTYEPKTVELQDVADFIENALDMDIKDVREVSLRGGQVEVYHWPEGKPGPLAVEIFYYVGKGR